MSRKIKWLALGLSVALLVFTRFVNLSWGLPYPFHPDERNIAVAIQQLQCTFPLDLKSCFNPHFFAYGQFPIYLGYIFVHLNRLITKVAGTVRFEEAVLALRFISAVASVATVAVSIRILRMFIRDTKYEIPYILLLIFSPSLIQFAHFGTTESLLMLFFSWLIFLCLKLDTERASEGVDSIYIWIGVVTGMAIATKVSSISFLLLPIYAVTLGHVRPRMSYRKVTRYEEFWQWFNELIFVSFITGATAILLSPHNLISWTDFIGSMEYESSVAMGTVQVFYTRTFSHSVPFLFQGLSIFPYALGVPVFALFIISFFVLPYSRKNNFLRFSFLAIFIPWSLAYTKWTRFMSPFFPLMVIFVAVFISRLPRWLGYVLVSICILPGIFFMNVYTSQDVRFEASKWMAKNIPPKSYILQETANVVDLPLFLETWNVESRTYKNISFNFYELDADPKLQNELKLHIRKADYIIIPSRRIFMNHSAKDYPILSKYYSDLFSGKLGFKKEAEFRTLNDEEAEETWTVFDHPVIRIFKRINPDS